MTQTKDDKEPRITLKTLGNYQLYLLLNVKDTASKAKSNKSQTWPDCSLCCSGGFSQRLFRLQSQHCNKSSHRLQTGQSLTDHISIAKDCYKRNFGKTKRRTTSCYWFNSFKYLIALHQTKQGKCMARPQIISQKLKQKLQTELSHG